MLTTFKIRGLELASQGICLPLQGFCIPGWSATFFLGAKSARFGDKDKRMKREATKRKIGLCVRVVFADLALKFGTFDILDPKQLAQRGHR